MSKENSDVSPLNNQITVFLPILNKPKCALYIFKYLYSTKEKNSYYILDKCYTQEIDKKYFMSFV